MSASVTAMRHVATVWTKASASVPVIVASHDEHCSHDEQRPREGAPNDPRDLNAPFRARLV
jgi:hypothetical protein